MIQINTKLKKNLKIIIFVIFVFSLVKRIILKLKISGLSSKIIIICNYFKKSVSFCNLIVCIEESGIMNFPFEFEIECFMSRAFESSFLILNSLF